MLPITSFSSETLLASMTVLNTSVADQLTMLLRDITTPEGDLIHCTNCEWTIEEGVLHVLVSYDHHAYIPQEPVLMETLDIEMDG